ISMILTPLEDGSQYYWEIKNVHYGERNNAHTGIITVFLRCAQRDDHNYQTSNSTVKRRSEAHRAIKRFSCHGSSKLHIDINKRLIKLSVSHSEAHEFAIHRQNRL